MDPSLYKYAYTLGGVIGLIFWILIFYKRKDLRRQMLVISFATMLLGPSDILYYGTYWKPIFLVPISHFGLDSFFVCFVYGGVCSAIYEFVSRNTTVKESKTLIQISKIEFVVSFLTGVIALALLSIFTDLNIIYTSSTALFVIGIMFIYFRRDLLKPAITAAIISVIISSIAYFIIQLVFPSFFDLFWIKDHITNIRLLGIPVEEYFFHFSLGLCLGVMYEVAYGLTDTKLKIKAIRKRKAASKLKI